MIWGQLDAKHRTLDDCKRELDPKNTGIIAKQQLSQWWYKTTKKEQKVKSRFQRMLTKINEDDIRTAFNKVDTEGTGKINFAQFCYSLEELKIRWGIDEAKQIFKKFDEKKITRTPSLGQ